MSQNTFYYHAHLFHNELVSQPSTETVWLFLFDFYACQFLFLFIFSFTFGMDNMHHTKWFLHIMNISLAVVLCRFNSSISVLGILNSWRCE